MKPLTNIRDICEHYLNDKAEDFALWAFGEEFKSITSGKLLIKWNELHGDILVLSGDSRPFDDIPKMIELWQKEKQPDS